ncbi:hypothetical protein NDU88_012534 [Pleurodeles waltl]|uniref:Uncharacterized protein n=1 Tax=Pleurodeles waltl TaxID=8319 RepID=A0AAV7R0C3_PLEWA|nr:hypothetical protein NDU88_012534 [Pleurodeles waltl]
MLDGMVNVGRHGAGMVNVGRHGACWTAWCMLDGMVRVGRHGACWTAWCMLDGMVRVGRHGACWTAWCMLDGMVHVGRHGACWTAWCMLDGMVHVGRHGACWTASPLPSSNFQLLQGKFTGEFLCDSVWLLGLGLSGEVQERDVFDLSLIHLDMKPMHVRQAATEVLMI